MTFDSFIRLCGNISGVLFRVFDSDGIETAEFWVEEYEQDYFSSCKVVEWHLMFKGRIPIIRVDLAEVEE